ncbi:MAG: Ribonuclease H [Parcubacteria group bacterium GW2011_GWA2_49_9]|nr:MAG: Ribonuclease H [Parcubacteria group bacterium GW2011_GWA2_49_9]
MGNSNGMNTKSDFTIFTDGSSRGNPGPGGWGTVIVFPKDKDGEIHIQELGAREFPTTNNRMELTAPIKALSFVDCCKLGAEPITVYTDSNYLINGITKWVHGWRKSGWVTKEKKEVLNRDLWEELFEQVQGKNITWKYVGGHVGVVGNERCDEIATAYADDKKVDLFDVNGGGLEKYPIKNILDVSHDASLAKEKSSNRTHSDAKAYSYVSLVGGRIETHKTWGECEARVKGKPAKFKKATSKEMEAEIISDFSRKK